MQVTKDPIGHKGARLTSQVSLPGRYLVYVPNGSMNGISRKLPDTERARLKKILKEVLPENAGVIVRTAAEGATEEQLTLDVERLTAQWAEIEQAANERARRRPPAQRARPAHQDRPRRVQRGLHEARHRGRRRLGRPSRVRRHVAPDLEDRLERYEREKDQDIFEAYRIDEQIKKALDRKVWLPSGGSLVIDRTEAMTVVDVNTGKFVGSGGNLEETVTKNNLEAAEEIVRQLRLRDIGGIIVVDFIDMVLESNRDLVLRRLVECLGRDRTRHQVAEVTSLGLVQMTRKRIGTGLLESFSHDCPHCHGRGVIIEDAPVEPKKAEEEPRRARRNRSRGGPGPDGADRRPSRPHPRTGRDGQATTRSTPRTRPRISPRSRREDPDAEDLAEGQREDQAEATRSAGAGRAGDDAPPSPPTGPPEVEPFDERHRGAPEPEAAVEPEPEPEPAAARAGEAAGRDPHPAPVGEPSGRAACLEPGRRS